MPEHDPGWAARNAALRVEIEMQIVDALEGARAFEADTSRRLLLRRTQLHTQFALQVTAHSISRQWFLELVDQCSRDPTGPAAIRDAVRAIAPRTTTHAELVHLVECWETTDVAATATIPWRGGATEDHDPRMPPLGGSASRRAAATSPVDVWALLRSELEAVAVPQVLPAFREATEHRAAVAPWHCTSAWRLFVYLADQARRPGVAEPYAVFLVRLMQAQLLSSPTERRVDAWIRKVAAEQGWTAMLNRLHQRAVAPAPALAHRADADRIPRFHLVMRLENAAWGAGRYHLCWYLEQSEPVHIVSTSERSGLLQREALEDTVGRLVHTVGSGLHEPPGQLALEFVLPIGLLDAEVEWWRALPPQGRRRPLALDYPITLRSLDRMYMLESHPDWRARWRYMNEPATAVTYWCLTTPDVDQLALEGELRARGDLTVLVLSGPPIPGSRGLSELIAGLRTGVGGIVWSRANGDDPTATAASLRAYVAAGRGADLPAGADQLRRAAQAMATAEQSHHLGRHLALLWDEPDGLSAAPGGDGT